MSAICWYKISSLANSLSLRRHLRLQINADLLPAQEITLSVQVIAVKRKRLIYQVAHTTGADQRLMVDIGGTEQ